MEICRFSRNAFTGLIEPASQKVHSEEFNQFNLCTNEYSVILRDVSFVKIPLKEVYVHFNSCCSYKTYLRYLFFSLSLLLILICFQALAAASAMLYTCQSWIKRKGWKHNRKLSFVASKPLYSNDRDPRHDTYSFVMKTKREIQNMK